MLQPSGAGLLSPHHLLLLTLFFLLGCSGAAALSGVSLMAPGRTAAPQVCFPLCAAKQGEEKGIILGAAILHPDTSNGPSQRRDVEASPQLDAGQMNPQKEPHWVHRG